MNKQIQACQKRIISLLACLLLCGTVVFAQRTVSGSVTDAESNEPLIGANIFVQGTSTGTVTDFNGEYSLTVPDGATNLVISYTGYADQVLAITGNVLNASLSAGALLDDVVVVGYGTVKKRDITGSVASLKEEDFNQGIVVSADQLLQGRLAGVNVVNNSGQPGGLATVKIRGNNSIRAGADPLYVVDGVPLDGRTPKASISQLDGIGSIANSNPLNFLNPSDIASIEVLKDASSAAIYGSRASNGVILITTKKAREGKLDVNFNTNFGTSSILKKYDVLSGDEYRSAISDYGISAETGSANTDAFDEILQRGSTQNYNLSVGSGTENSRVRFSAGYQNIDGIVKESGLQRFSGALNAQYDLLDDRAGVDFFVVSSHTIEDIAPIGTNAGFRGNLVGQALQWNPTVPLMTGDEFTTGLNSTLVGATTINPLQLLKAHNEVANTTTILASFSPYVNITDNLVYRYRFAANYGTGTSRGYITKDINIEGIEGLGSASLSNNRLLTNLHAHTLNFNTDVNDNISLDLLGGYEYQKFDFKGFGFTGRGFDDVNEDFDLSNALQNSNNDNRSVFSFADPKVELQSFFARAVVGIGDRFDVTATVRADGSTKFGDNNRYGVFPSFAARWNLVNESFLSGGFFDDLALRAGWGVTGNQEFPAGSSIDRYGLQPNGGIAQENIGNPDLQWEESSTINLGLDFAMFNYKLAGTIEYYNRTTSSLLLDPFVQEPGPPIRAWKNIDGELINSGVELGLTAFLIQNSNMTLTLGTNWAFLNNELRDYTGPDILTGNLFGQGSSGAFVQKHANGMPLNTFFVREFTGLDSDTGVSTYSNDGEPVLLGNPNADIIMGATLGLEMGKISFGMNWNGAFGHQLFNNTAMSVIPIGNLGSRNVDAALIGSGVQESVANPIASSTRYIEDGDFVKLANATLSYNVGSVSSFDNVGISLTGQNLLLLTNYSGFDPEINTVNLRNGVPSAGIEYIPYPSARSIILGINVSF